VPADRTHTRPLLPAASASSASSLTRAAWHSRAG
jgi:hypothetical protein